MLVISSPVYGQVGMTHCETGSVIVCSDFQQIKIIDLVTSSDGDELLLFNRLEPNC